MRHWGVYRSSRYKDGTNLNTKNAKLCYAGNSSLKQRPGFETRSSSMTDWVGYKDGANLNTKNAKLCYAGNSSLK